MLAEAGRLGDTPPGRQRCGHRPYNVTVPQISMRRKRILRVRQIFSDGARQGKPAMTMLVVVMSVIAAVIVWRRASSARGLH